MGEKQTDRISQKTDVAKDNHISMNDGDLDEADLVGDAKHKKAYDIMKEMESSIPELNNTGETAVKYRVYYSYLIYLMARENIDAQIIKDIFSTKPFPSVASASRAYHCAYLIGGEFALSVTKENLSDKELREKLMERYATERLSDVLEEYNLRTIDELVDFIARQDREIRDSKRIYDGNLSFLNRVLSEVSFNVKEGFRQSNENLAGMQEKLKSEYEEEINSLKEKHEEEISDLKDQHQRELLAKERAFETDKTIAINKYKAEVEELKQANADLISKLESIESAQNDPGISSPEPPKDADDKVEDKESHHSDDDLKEKLEVSEKARLDAEAQLSKMRKEYEDFIIHCGNMSKAMMAGFQPGTGDVQRGDKETRPSTGNRERENNIRNEKCLPRRKFFMSKEEKRRIEEEEQNRIEEEERRIKEEERRTKEEERRIKEEERRAEEEEKRRREEAERSDFIIEIMSNPDFSNEQYDIMFAAIKAGLSTSQLKKVCVPTLPAKNMLMIANYYLRPNEIILKKEEK